MNMPRASQRTLPLSENVLNILETAVNMSSRYMLEPASISTVFANGGSFFNDWHCDGKALVQATVKHPDDLFLVEHPLIQLKKSVLIARRHDENGNIEIELWHNKKGHAHKDVIRTMTREHTNGTNVSAEDDVISCGDSVDARQIFSACSQRLLTESDKHLVLSDVTGLMGPPS